MESRASSTVEERSITLEEVKNVYRTCPDCGAALDPGERCDCDGRAPHKEPERREPRVEYRTEPGGVIRAIIYERR